MANYLSITLHSTTLVLAYFQYYTCKFLPGRCLPARHLRRLSTWLDQPDKSLFSLRNHPTLAAHLALLAGTNLLAHNDAHWYVTPRLFQWLEQPAADKFAALIKSLDSCQFETASVELGLSAVLTVDVKAYLHQQFERQSDSYQHEKPEAAAWKSVAPDEWQLVLPQALPCSLLFHLLQLGLWLPQQPLSITPYSISQAVRRGYSLKLIQYIMEEVTGQMLPTSQIQQMVAWLKRTNAYRLHPVHLLSAKRPEQLLQLIKNRNLRRHIQEQIGPRHAIVSPAIQMPLQKWAVRHNYYLDQFPDTTKPDDLNPSGYQWLGLKLLVSLGQVLPLPYPAPHTALEALSRHVTPEEQVQLSTLADEIVESIQDAISGRDAFFPARQSPTTCLLQQFKDAMQNQAQIRICYRAFNAPEPKWHTVEPLRLEQVGDLYYLTAYSYRAEANLTFRLDRIEGLCMDG